MCSRCQHTAIGPQGFAVLQYPLTRPAPDDTAWRHDVLDSECHKFAGQAEATDGKFVLRWKRTQIIRG